MDHQPITKGPPPRSTAKSRFDRAKRERLGAFLAHPTVVVVDEAHHGGAQTYHQVLKACVELGARSVLGLTATPWPSALLSAKRFREIFGESHDPIFQISVEELTEKEVLARPIYHVVESDESYLLSEEEVARSEKAIDIDPEVLGKLNDPRRNRVVVESYLTKQNDLGKTLVFAGSIAHAEALLRAFRRRGVPVRAIHGQADTSRDKALEWFADVAEPAVLVSVRMLTEGVDLPHARSVILARPTTSRILLRQMVGRALRGRLAGGSDVAHIVYIRDQWEGLGDLLEPPEVLEVVDIETRTDRPRPGRWGDPWELGDLPIVDDEGQTLPASVGVEVERMVSENRQHLERVQDEEDRDFPVRLTTSALVGWYELPMRRIAVFEHQRAGFDAVIESAGENLQGSAVSQAFDDIAPPRPSRRTILELREHVQTFGVPRFTPFLDRSLPRSVAEILSTGSRTDAEVGELIRTTWRTGAARLSMSLREFEEEVDAERRRLRHKAQGEPGGLSPESAGTVHEPWDLPTLPFVERDLKPLVSDVLAWMAEETPTLVDRISPQLKALSVRVT